VAPPTPQPAIGASGAPVFETTWIVRGVFASVLPESPARQLGSFRLYARLSKLLGSGTTQMFNDLPSFEISADWTSIFVPSALNVG
jgi:hypothetical protein